MKDTLSVNISVGRSCFVMCPACYNHFGKENLSTETILSFLDSVRRYNVNKVTLCGGDPLSRPDIIFLLEEIRKRDFLINLDTVGTSLIGDTETTFFGNYPVARTDVIRLTELVDMIGIPMDGLNNEVFQLFRKNRPDIFNEQLKIIKLLLEHKGIICLNTVVHKGNIDHLISELPRFLEQMAGVRKWQFFQFMPTGPLGFKNRENYNIDEHSFDYFINKVTEIFTAARNISNVEFKSRASRKGNYMLVDSDGTAWTPKTTYFNKWNDYDATNNRFIIGNINRSSDYQRIINVILNPHLLYATDALQPFRINS